MFWTTTIYCCLFYSTNVFNSSVFFGGVQREVSISPFRVFRIFRGSKRRTILIGPIRPLSRSRRHLFGVAIVCPTVQPLPLASFEFESDCQPLEAILRIHTL